jgi:uroporphyrin-III C-methyltransferase/precorrin-2 dehydrogenase/sirohydrochlorin ferrochelatase
VDTPAAIVQHGTTSSQRVVVGTLRSLPGLAEAAKLQAPTLIIVGEVVRLHAKLAWFDSEPEQTVSSSPVARSAMVA